MRVVLHREPGNADSFSYRKPPPAPETQRIQVPSSPREENQQPQYINVRRRKIPPNPNAPTRRFARYAAYTGMALAADGPNDNPNNITDATMAMAHNLTPPSQPPQMPAGSPPTPPPSMMGIPSAPSSPDYSSTTATASLGTYELMRQSQMEPTGGSAESHFPFIHGEG